RRAFPGPHNRPLRPNDAEKSGEDLAYSFSGRVYDLGSNEPPNNENQHFGFFTVLGERFVGQLHSETHLYKIESVSEEFARITEVPWGDIPPADSGGAVPSPEDGVKLSGASLRAYNVVEEGTHKSAKGNTEINVAVVFAN